MIAVLFALAAVSAPPSASLAKEQARAYTVEEIAYARSIAGDSDWRLVNVTDALMIFARPYAGSPGANPRIWLRAEHYPLAPPNPLGAGESFVSVHEIDCPSKRERTLSSTLYAGANLGGDIVAASDKPSEWQPVKPDGSVGRAAETLCPGYTNAPAGVSEPDRPVPPPMGPSGQGRRP